MDAATGDRGSERIRLLPELLDRGGRFLQMTAFLFSQFLFPAEEPLEISCQKSVFSSFILEIPQSAGLEPIWGEGRINRENLNTRYE